MFEATLNVLFKNEKMRSLKVPAAMIVIPPRENSSNFGKHTALYRRMACSFAVVPLRGTLPSDTLEASIMKHL
jgi:hypothetical protein